MPESVWMALLKQGYIFDAINRLMENLMGGYYYVIIFGSVWAVTYSRSKDIGLATIVLMWTTAIWGYTFPGTVGSGVVTLAIMVGIASMIHKALSTAK